MSLTKLSLLLALLVPAASFASSFAQEGYYGSAKLLSVDQKAKNMDTSARPGIGSFVAGDNSERYVGGSLGLGYAFGNGWRVEGEYTLPKKNEYTSGSSTFQTSYNHHKIKSQRLMINAYKDMPLNEQFAVYGQVGLGIAQLKSSGWQGNESRQYGSNSDQNLAYSVGVGVSYAPTQKLTLDLGYRYVDMGKTESSWNNFANARGLQDEQMKAKVVSNEIMLGARYAF